MEAEGQNEFLSPLDEIHFWKSKSANIANLNDQLRDGKVTQILDILEKNSSTYVIGFQKTLAELKEGRLFVACCFSSCLFFTHF